MGIVTLSEDALGAGLSNAEVYYGASFVEEKSVSSFAQVETSAGPSDGDLDQTDKYFYFES